MTHGVDIGKYEVVHETDNAILVRDEEDEEIWIPKSCVHDDSPTWKRGQKGTVIVTEWWAKKEGLD